MTFQVYVTFMVKDIDDNKKYYKVLKEKKNKQTRL